MGHPPRPPSAVTVLIQIPKSPIMDNDLKVVTRLVRNASTTREYLTRITTAYSDLDPWERQMLDQLAPELNEALIRAEGATNPATGTRTG